MHILIQARMSSNRLPGKVLKSLCSKPLIKHITDNLRQNLPESEIIIITSRKRSDDVISNFAQSEKVKCYRGSLENVYERFCGAIKLHSIPHFVRICADSPLLDIGLVQTSIEEFKSQDVDLVTNIFPRSFPKGQSVEVIRSTTFASETYRQLENFSAEHVTQAFYHNSQRYKIVNLLNSIDQSKETLAIDTFEDMLNTEDYLTRNSYPTYMLKAR
jgi:spore coat polysaccharide biosynthesis protein SpsF